MITTLTRALLFGSLCAMGISAAQAAAPASNDFFCPKTSTLTTPEFSCENSGCCDGGALAGVAFQMNRHSGEARYQCTYFSTRCDAAGMVSKTRFSPYNPGHPLRPNWREVNESQLFCTPWQGDPAACPMPAGK